MTAIRRFGFVLAVPLCAGVALARDPQSPAVATVPVQAAPAPAPVKPPAAPPTVSYMDGLMKIDALDATLADILAKVTAVTGVKMDLPPAASDIRMPVVKLGPGPARQILASLLSDSDYDYLIQASEIDPSRIQSVVILQREKKGARPNGPAEMAERLRHPFGRPGPMSAEPEEAAPAPEPAAALSAPAESVPDAPAAPPVDQPPPPPIAEPGQPVQPGMFNGTKAAPLAPPASFDQQTINQQLQQMYQQRAQMNQTVAPTAPTTPTGK